MHAVLGELRCIVECYRRRQTTKGKTILARYTMCRRASNNTLSTVHMDVCVYTGGLCILDAVAASVEQAGAVLACFSRKYKDSRRNRLGKPLMTSHRFSAFWLRSKCGHLSEMGEATTFHTCSRP